MGTKNNPGEFDCYANAEPDEPMFVLLGRDRHAPDLVEEWAGRREREHEDPAVVSEAMQCAANMRRYREDRIERRCQALAPEIGVSFGMNSADSVALLRLVAGDAAKARVAARLLKELNIGIGHLGTILDLARP
jgi:hypothetical protein